LTVEVGSKGFPALMVLRGSRKRRRKENERKWNK
jgi:hypothetical protein